jgi:hypothetical protein
MSSRRRSELNAPITPLKFALAATVVAYLLSAAVARQFSPPEVTTPLLSISALVIALVSIVAVYTALSMAASPPIDKGAIRAAESRAALIAMMVAARKEANASLARTSPWWRYLVAAIGGFTFGVFLARGITWFLS